MKLLSIPILLLLCVTACQDNKQEPAVTDVRLSEEEAIPAMDSTRFTTVQWLDSLKDFGTVQNGEKVDILFRFRNTGDKPLTVYSVSAACGCTVPEYTKEPVMPGKEGFVKAVFNSAGQTPVVHKTVTVQMNTSGQQYHVLAFVGEIKN